MEEAEAKAATTIGFFPPAFQLPSAYQSPNANSSVPFYHVSSSSSFSEKHKNILFSVSVVQRLTFFSTSQLSASYNMCTNSSNSRSKSNFLSSLSFSRCPFVTCLSRALVSTYNSSSSSTTENSKGNLRLISPRSSGGGCGIINCVGAHNKSTDIYFVLGRRVFSLILFFLIILVLATASVFSSYFLIDLISPFPASELYMSAALSPTPLGALDRVSQRLPLRPQSFKIIDWYRKAENLLNFVFRNGAYNCCTIFNHSVWYGSFYEGPYWSIPSYLGLINYPEIAQDVVNGPGEGLAVIGLAFGSVAAGVWRPEMRQELEALKMYVGENGVIWNNPLNKNQLPEIKSFWYSFSNTFFLLGIFDVVPSLDPQCAILQKCADSWYEATMKLLEDKQQPEEEEEGEEEQPYLTLAGIRLHEEDVQEEEKAKSQYGGSSKGEIHFQKMRSLHSTGSLNRMNNNTSFSSPSLSRPDLPNFRHTGFDFQTMRPFNNGLYTEADSAAGIAWVAYSAYIRLGSPKYLELVKLCLGFLTSLAKSPLYEVSLAYAVVIAARMNVEENTTYDLDKLLTWTLGEGDNEVRYGWGMISDSFGGVHVSGLIGSLTDGGGYAFLGNTLWFVGALTPICKYAPRYAKLIGKWLTNVANSARYFYGDSVTDSQQSNPHDHRNACADPDDVVAYEGIRKCDFDHLQGRCRTPETEMRGPFATGDWCGRKNCSQDIIAECRKGVKCSEASDRTLYGVASVGTMAAIVVKTNDSDVLQFDLSATDFYASQSSFLTPRSKFRHQHIHEDLLMSAGGAQLCTKLRGSATYLYYNPSGKETAYVKTTFETTERRIQQRRSLKEKLEKSEIEFIEAELVDVYELIEEGNSTNEEVVHHSNVSLERQRELRVGEKKEGILEIEGKTKRGILAMEQQKGAKKDEVVIQLPPYGAKVMCFLKSGLVASEQQQS